MKKILLGIVILIPLLAFSTTHELVTSGEYKGWYKLLDYEGDNKFDAYFKVSRRGTIISEQQQLVANYKSVNLNEKITINIDGKNVTHTRKVWYDIINKATGNLTAYQATKLLETKYPDLADDYYSNNFGFNSRVVSNYIDTALKLEDIPEEQNSENSFCKQTNLSPKDQKLCNDLAEKEAIDKITTTPVDESNVKTKKSNKLLESIVDTFF